MSKLQSANPGNPFAFGSWWWMVSGCVGGKKTHFPVLGCTKVFDSYTKAPTTSQQWSGTGQEGLGWAKQPQSHSTAVSPSSRSKAALTVQPQTGASSRSIPTLCSPLRSQGRNLPWGCSTHSVPTFICAFPPTLPTQAEAQTHTIALQHPRIKLLYHKHD